MNQLKVFTLKEANQTLTQIQPLLEDLRNKRNEILSLEVEIDALELISTAADKENPSALISRKVEDYTKLVNRFYALIETIQNSGCIIKDIETGLVDFYSLYKGKVVYLCWRMGEAEITHWHEIGSGFAGRQPLEIPAE